MDVAQLHRLSRILREVALQAAAQDGDEKLSPSQITVIEDVARHPKTTAQQIVQRTGIAQSQISTIVAELKQLKVFVVAPAPHDKRKQLIQITPTVRKTIFKARGKLSVTKSLDQLYPDLTPFQRQHTEKLLNELMDLLNVD